MRVVWFCLILPATLLVMGESAIVGWGMGGMKGLWIAGGLDAIFLGLALWMLSVEMR